ncbi:hypothetical protein CFIMG_007801RA00001 [Ceratocystis fimbriata CBS 114723]|uniref:Uncharacterized protein n=1 Tax=Ceratocystis fimbriata CBS 114723 TaxID=1035309 RepID=A0A2C5WSN2_9PEZI|nr:hypothetical protein CFIMG_007801RA00001 [Ceratocystis fimbriata CBS 114723]
MAIWHFRKKSTDGRKRPRSGNSLSDVEDSSPSPPQTDTVLAQDTEPSATRPQQPRTPKRRSTLKKKRRTEPPSQSRPHGDASTGHARAFSFTEERPESISPQVLPEVIVQDNIVWEIPTLSPHRPERTNRSPKKHYRRDAVRETEIQAISTVLNTRPNSTCSRQISRKTSSKHKHSSSLQHRYTSDDRDEMEFPSAESLRSSMSSDGTDSAAYLVTVLGSLAPRPTLKCTSRPNWSPNVDRTSASRAHRSIDLSPTPSNIKSRARINGLADAFDSTDLRTVMERDQRRRERKRIRDQERAAERIARKKAEQVALAEQAAASKSTPPRNMERGVLGRELMDPVEIHPEPSTPQRMEIDELVLEESSLLNNSRPATPESLVSGDGGDASSVLSVVENQDYGMDNASIEADVGVVINSPTYPSSELLPEGLASNETVDQTEIDRNRLQPEVFVESEPQPTLQTRPHASSVSFTPTLSPSAIIASDVDQSSTSTRRRSLRTMLRWGSRKRKKAQPVFINTSRDAISIETARSREFASSIYDSSDYELPIPNNPTRIVPRRTRSRFREDLPELPISPPASPLRQERDLSTIMSVSERMSVLYSSTSSPTSTRHGRHRSIDALNCNSPTPLERQVQNELEGDEQLTDTPSPEPRSISMASVGSESEWLAGRLSSRNLPISRSTSRRYADSPELDYDDEATNKVSTEFRFVRGSSSQAHYTDENVRETVGQEGGGLADVMGDGKACANTDTVAGVPTLADTRKNTTVLEANVLQQSLDAEDHQPTTGSGNMF